MPKDDFRLHFKVTQRTESKSEKAFTHTYVLEPVQTIVSSKIQLKIVLTKGEKMKDDIGVTLEEIGDMVEVKFGKKNVQGKLGIPVEDENVQQRDQS
jgi:hypothetical protein